MVKKKSEKAKETFTFFVGNKKIVIEADDRGEAIKLLNKLHE